MGLISREIRRLLYNPLIDLLRLIEVWSKYRLELQKSVQKYSALKIESAYLNQKSCLCLNMFSLNQSYISGSAEAIQDQLNHSKNLAIEKMQEISQIQSGIDEIYTHLSSFTETYNEMIYSSIIGGSSSGISVDIVLDFLCEWKDCIESDIKVQNKIFNLIEKLKSYHTRNIQACLSYFQCSPYGDILEGKENYINLKKCLREFITQ
ncbi:hypothetical protein [Cryptosporidium parvum Iowa II]|uniref:Uncharacterized protein n=2 Tax=Cryptosporidium parvum TaxID=5807 RepID=Q5CVJ3_CRYPI|nr:hypothetical protein [Cryptosporidium parvum Iowa II]EAK89539.1 hypothetical protein cgd8_3840 [Cryptosporidium parvum Iowa II]QOY40150.1 Uncharacterized protein CPATCC_0004060 [Cryptosporidium parvum]WKS79646.1 hypothetical protein CPCDC_8g3840 [Cryptosporidium sp. 43IA8]WRK34148.1 Uncharacterized protein cpbgf_8003840 [Cryptosporidium parvum]|eukprot:QOY40150.1 hypothetical protein CPATCC_004240 [Cryptosporidium parvum]